MSFRSDRTFQLWDYSVSHARMLLRSAASPGVPTNIDVVFFGVERVEIPTTMRGGLEIAEPEPFVGEHGKQSRLFRVTANGRQSAVVALACVVLENQLDYIDSALDHLIGEGIPEALGETLYQSFEGRRRPKVAGQASA
jgi:hypothetical protein